MYMQSQVDKLLEPQSNSTILVSSCLEIWRQKCSDHQKWSNPSSTNLTLNLAFLFVVQIQNLENWDIRRNMVKFVCPKIGEYNAETENDKTFTISKFWMGEMLKHS